MNIGYDDDELKPFKESPADVLDPVRIGNTADTLVCSESYTLVLLSYILWGQTTLFAQDRELSPFSIGTDMYV